MLKALKQTLSSNNISEVKAILKSSKRSLLHPREIAEELNKHFPTTGQKLSNALCPSGVEVLVEPKSKRKFSLNHVSIEFVTRLCVALKRTRLLGFTELVQDFFYPLVRTVSQTAANQPKMQCSSKRWKQCL